MKNYLSLACLTCIFLLAGCYEAIIDQTEESQTSSMLTRAYDTPYLDWEADIFPGGFNNPWNGVGSLQRDFDSDILLDRSPSDGWVLLYNTFIEQDVPLNDPFFVLYNKYRGLMRVYYLLTSTDITYSSYMLGRISMNDMGTSKILNFLGTDVFDNRTPVKQYSFFVPSESSSPVTPRQWYMLEYEMAYDPQVSSYNTDNLNLWLDMEYYNVETINLGGTATSDIYGTIGSNENKSVMSDIGKTGKIAGKGALGIIGKKIFSKDNLGLSDAMKERLFDGSTKLLESSKKNLPGAAMKLLSAIVGGNSSGPTPISLNMITEFELEGEAKNSGSLTGFGMMVPGTTVTNNYKWQVPTYNKPLGIVGLSGTPLIPYKKEFGYSRYLDPQFGNTELYEIYQRVYLPHNVDISQWVAINPEVQKVANVEIVAQELVLIREDGSVNMIDPERRTVEVHEEDMRGTPPYTPTEDANPFFMDEYYFDNIGVRLSISVEPTNGGEPVMLYKTFRTEKSNGLNPTLVGPKKVKEGETITIKLANCTDDSFAWTSWGGMNAGVVESSKYECTFKPFQYFPAPAYVTATLYNENNYELKIISINLPFE